MHPAKELLHKLWGKAKEAENYNKKEWLALQVFINESVRLEEAAKRLSGERADRGNL